MIKLMRHNRDTECIVAIRIVQGDTVQIRYMQPIESEWISEYYSLDTMLKAGWEVVE